MTRFALIAAALALTFQIPVSHAGDTYRNKGDNIVDVLDAGYEVKAIGYIGIQAPFLQIWTLQKNTSVIECDVLLTPKPLNGGATVFLIKAPSECNELVH